jgi:hypothetical protein
MLVQICPMSRAGTAMLGGPQLRPSIPSLDDSGSGSEESEEEQNQTAQDLVIRVAARCTNARFRGNFTGG